MNFIFQLFLTTAILVGVQPIDKDLQLDKDSAIFLFTYDGYFTKIDPANNGNTLWSTKIINGTGSLISSSTTNNILQLDPSVWLVLSLQSDYVFKYGHDYNTITPQLVDKLKINSLKRLVEQKLIYLVYMSSESGDVHAWRQHSNFATMKTDIKESIIIELEVRLVNSDELDDSVGDRLSWKFKRSQINKIQYKKHDKKEKERFKNLRKENRTVFFQLEKSLICEQNTDADPKTWEKRFPSPIVAAWGFVKGQFQDLNLLSNKSMSEFLLLVKHKEEIYIQPSSLMKENFDKNPLGSLNINEKMPNFSSTHFKYSIFTGSYPWLNWIEIAALVVLLIIIVCLIDLFIFNKPHLEDNYEQFVKIGSGGFGVVLKARHKIEGKDFALKCISYGTIWQYVFGKAIMQRNYKRGMSEIQTLSQLDHPNIVIHYNSWKEKRPKIKELNSLPNASKCLFIRMELCEKTLASWLLEDSLQTDSTKKMNRETSENMLKQLLKGVGYIHKEDIIHRDLNPGNIFLLNSDSIALKIGDFGLAVKNNGKNKGKACGTKFYIAPEVLEAITEEHYYTKKVDVYALGVVFRKILSHVNRDNPDMPEYISLMLKKKPEERYSIEEVCSEMYQCSTEELLKPE